MSSVESSAQYPASIPQEAGNGLAIAGFVTSILGLILSVIPFGLFGVGAILDIVAIGFGAIGRKRAKRLGVRNGGLAVAGMALGFLGLAIFILWVALLSTGNVFV